MKLLLLTALAGIGLQAATITFGPVSQLGGFNPGDQTSYSRLIQLPQFNPALGTLTGIEITVDTQMNKSGNLQNNGSSAAPLSYNYTLALITVNGTGVTHSQAGSVAFTAGETFLNVPGNGGQAIITSLQEQDLNNIFNPANLAAFTGLGLMDYTVDASAILVTGCGSGNCQTNIATLMGAQMTITYTYDLPNNDVPEPTTFALFGLGIVGLGLLKRRS